MKTLIPAVVIACALSFPAFAGWQAPAETLDNHSGECKADYNKYSLTGWNWFTWLHCKTRH